MKVIGFGSTIYKEEDIKKQIFYGINYLGETTLSCSKEALPNIPTGRVGEE